MKLYIAFSLLLLCCGACRNETADFAALRRNCEKNLQQEQENLYRQNAWRHPRIQADLDTLQQRFLQHKSLCYNETSYARQFTILLEKNRNSFLSDKKDFAPLYAAFPPTLYYPFPDFAEIQLRCMQLRSMEYVSGKMTGPCIAIPNNPLRWFVNRSLVADSVYSIHAEVYMPAGILYTEHIRLADGQALKPDSIMLLTGRIPLPETFENAVNKNERSNISGIVDEMYRRNTLSGEKSYFIRNGSYTAGKTEIP